MPEKSGLGLSRISIFTTHPIQYQAPWFRALAATPNLEIEVVFAYVPDADEQGRGFGRAFEWDIPLRDGYPSRVLTSWMLPHLSPRFVQRIARGIATALDSFRPDVALVLGWQELTLVQALLTCRRLGLPVVLRGESNGLRVRQPWVTMLHRHYFGQFDAFLAIGRANSAFYRGAGVPEERIVTAAYFVDNERFRTQTDSFRIARGVIRSGWGIPYEGCCLAFVGKLQPKKRILDFLHGVALAQAQGSRVHALVVGSGEQLEEAKTFAEGAKLSATFAGFLNQSEICRAYAAADALVLPSDYGETWGLVVNEAMATGLPAIVSDRVGCSDDLVIDGLTGRVFPFGDTRALASAMLSLAADAHGRERLGKLAQTRVFSDFSIAKAVDGVLAAADIAVARRRSETHGAG